MSGVGGFGLLTSQLEGGVTCRLHIAITSTRTKLGDKHHKLSIANAGNTNGKRDNTLLHFRLITGVFPFDGHGDSSISR